MERTGFRTTVGLCDREGGVAPQGLGRGMDDLVTWHTIAGTTLHTAELCGTGLTLLTLQQGRGFNCTKASVGL